MSVTIGTQLGSYEITSLIGKGGMGEVYRARDTKLKRDVAIKILPEEFSRDPDRVNRFQREAQVLASLNHPNIAAIHSFEEANEMRFLVLELVEGETLADRIARGPIAVEEALHVAIQICDAFEAAHEKGIVHRDLKPANVKITPDGKVKVLDFGLAKVGGNDSPTKLSELPTVTGTRDGVIWGTTFYMSPEQARGQKLDKRTDIWAFGCVLYELLSQRRAFAGETLNDIIAGVLEREPDWQALPPSTPRKVRDLLHKCFRKDIDRRLHDIADARIEIEEALTAPLSAEQPAGVESSTRKGWRGPILWSLASAVMGVIASVAVFRLLVPTSSPTQPSLTRFAMDLPADQQLAGVNVPAVDVSPDGKQVAYVASRGGSSQLYLRALDSVAKPIPGTEGAYGPFFSPDGQWVGFFAAGKLKKVAVSGGAPVTVTDVPQACGASWASGDNIVFTPFQFQGVMEVPAAGGTPQVLTNLDIKNGEV